MRKPDFVALQQSLLESGCFFVELHKSAESSKIALTKSECIDILVSKEFFDALQFNGKVRFFL